MLTIFSHFKPFEGHFGVIQRNAVRSWSKLGGGVEILLFGSAPGTAEMAAEIGALHIPEVRKNGHGVALMNGLFEQAADVATNELLCFVNGDIVLIGDLLESARRIGSLRYMAVGRRTDLDLDHLLEFEPGWEDRLHETVAREGQLHDASAIDYFLFRRSLVDDLEMPDFAIGRPKWDNWTLYRVRAMGLHLIDLTRVVTAVHQNHDYAHHARGREGILEEGRDSFVAAGGKSFLFFIRDASHTMTEVGLQRNRETPMERRLQTLAVLHPQFRRPLNLARRFLLSRA